MLMHMKHLLALLLPAFLLLPAPAAEKAAPAGSPEKNSIYLYKGGILKGTRQPTDKQEGVYLLEAGGKPLICQTYRDSDLEYLAPMHTFFSMPLKGRNWQTRKATPANVFFKNITFCHKHGLNRSISGFVYDKTNSQVLFLFSGIEDDGDVASDPPTYDRFCCLTMKPGKKPTKAREKNIESYYKEIKHLGGYTTRRVSGGASTHLHPCGLCLEHKVTKGRLLFLMTMNDEKIVSFFSDDGGTSWHYGTPFDVRAIKSQNPSFWKAFLYDLKLFEASNGDLIAYNPHSTINPCLSSSTGGLTWELNMPSPERQYEAMADALLLVEAKNRHASEGKLLAVHIPGSDEEENRLSISLSNDWGKTWAYTRQANKGTGVAALCTTSPGKIAMLYMEKDSPSPTMFTEFTLDWLTSEPSSDIPDSEQPTSPAHHQQ